MMEDAVRITMLRVLFFPILALCFFLAIAMTPAAFVAAILLVSWRKAWKWGSSFFVILDEIHR